MATMLDTEEQIKVDCQLDDFKNAKGEFGSQVAVRTQNIRLPSKILLFLFLLIYLLYLKIEIFHI